MRRGSSLLVASIVAVALPACTSFDDALATQGYFDFAGATRVCARLAACTGLAGSVRQSLAAPVDDASFSVCMSWLAGPSPTPPGGFAAQAAALQAIGGAATCEEAAAGLAIVEIAPPATECANGVASHCIDDTHLADCAGLRVVTCGAPPFAAGGKCVKAPGGAVCTTGSPCTLVATSVNGCEASTLSLCDPVAKLADKLDCAALGEGCQVSSTTLHLGAKIAVCTDPGNDAADSVCASATGSGFTTCSADGAMAIVCDEVKTFGTLTYGAIEVRYPCGDLGLHCAGGVDGSIPSCVPSDAECTATDADVNACDGDRIALCVSGRRVTVDCGAVGASCSGPAGGARCLAP